MPGEEAPRVWTPSSIDGALRQCEILSGVTLYHVKADSLTAEELVFEALTLPLVMVVSQDCDLDWDWKNRFGEPRNANKALPSVLLLRVDEAQPRYDEGGAVRSGWKQIQQNKNDRYQFFQQVRPDDDVQRQGLPELLVDFKSYYAVPTDVLYASLRAQQTRRRCALTAPYLQHLAQRFGAFQGRVALPLDHQSEP